MISFHIWTWELNTIQLQASDIIGHTGKSLSEALIFASTNPQYDDRLFIELFLTFRTIFVQNMFSPCSAKRRSSDKDLYTAMKCQALQIVIYVIVYYYIHILSLPFQMKKIDKTYIHLYSLPHELNKTAFNPFSSTNISFMQ